MKRRVNYNPSMIRFLHIAAAAACAALAACGAGSAPPPPPAVAASIAPGDQLTRLVESYWDEYQRLNPAWLPQGAAVRYDRGEGWDIGAQSIADALAFERRYLAALAAVPRARLSAPAQLTYDIFKRERELAAESFTYPSELLPVNPFRSMPLEFAQTGAGQDQYAILSAKDFENWQSRADGYVRWTAEAIANLRDGLRRGYTLPRPLVAQLLPLLSRLGADTPANLFYQSLRSVPSTAPDADRRRFSDGITAGVRDKILPAYRTLHDFLRDEYLPRARQTVGLSVLPLGDAWYAFLIKRETASHQTAAELHALGLAEVERLHARVQSLLAEAGFAGNAQAFFEATLRNPRAAFDKPEDVTGYYEQLKIDAAGALPTLFEGVPQADFAIRRLDDSLGAAAPALFYRRAPNRNSAAILFVNAPAGAAQPLVPSVAAFLREALPGHHLQIATQTERAELPRFRRFGGDPGFVEGWGVYAQSLGEELGLYRDTESKFAALQAQLRCAAGLVVDTGVNSQGWSAAQALEYLRSQAAIDEAAARAAVDRDIALPGEALACAMGAHAMRALRARAEQALGPRFDIHAFHAALINDGAMPLDILDAKVGLWLNGAH